MCGVGSSSEDAPFLRTSIAPEVVEVALFESPIKAIDCIESRQACKSKTVGTCADDGAVFLVQLLLNEVMFASEEGKEFPAQSLVEHVIG